MTWPIRLLLVSAGVGCLPLLAANESDLAKRQLRRPVALALSDGGQTLFVANRDSGTLASIDVEGRRLGSEIRIGRRLSDLAIGPRSTVALTDEAAGQVILLNRTEDSFRELRRLDVGVTPVSVQISKDEKLVTVVCLWPRQIVLADVAVPHDSPLAKLDLPFAPRCSLLVSDKLIVGAAFGGELAVIDLPQRKVESVRRLPGHNIRGLALDREGTHLLLTCQTLNARGHTVAGDIRAGNVIDNQVRKFVLAEVLDAWADITRNERVYPLGDVERGAGDPVGVAESYDGHVLVTLAGVNELAIGRPEEVIWSRLPVGRRPTALAVDRSRRRAYVANTFADSISVIDLNNSKVIDEIRLGTMPTQLTPEQKGEMLFYDARLSLEGWYSCHSCHPDGHSNGRLNDNLSDGSFGTSKRVLSLLGVKDTGPWAWNGTMANLETQVRSSIISTMQGGRRSPDHIRELTAFLRTLSPPPSVRKARGRVDTAAIKRGRQVFSRQKCAACHTPPSYTSAKAYDVGLRDELGGSKFNPPSLRGVSQAGPYFHDGRALTLEEVFSRYLHETAGRLSPQELGDLLSFLESL